MNRPQADITAGVLIGGILILGIVGAVQLHLTGGPVAGDMDSTPLMAVIGPLLMTLGIASVIGGIYVSVRGQLFTTEDGDAATTARHEAPAGAETSEKPDTQPNPGSVTGQSNLTGRHDILAVLPDDERRILEPVIESPGLTQIKVRDRSDFSKSKVSQTITDLEKRGLLYRESQGRTYRVYPADDLEERL